MFDIREIQSSLRDSLNNDFFDILHSSGFGEMSHVNRAIGDFIQRLFQPDDNGSFKKPSKSTVDYSGSCHGAFNIIPSTNTSRHITDTLVVYCMGNENLLNLLIETIIAVGKHGFKYVLFVTTKWDISVVSGTNSQRLQDLCDYSSNGTRFCFMLVSTLGISRIPVI